MNLNVLSGVLPIIGASLYISICFFACLAKWRDRRYVRSWAANYLPVVPNEIALYLFLFIDIVLATMVILAIPTKQLSFVLSMCVVAVLVGRWLLRVQTGRTCPCFGQHSSSLRTTAIAMLYVAGSMGLVSIVWGREVVLFSDRQSGFVIALFSLLIAVVAFLCVGLANERVRWRAFSRSRKIEMEGFLKLRLREGDTTALLFASTSCTGCMQVAQLLSDCPSNDHLNVFIDIGKPVPESSKLGSAMLIYVERSVARQLGVFARPSLFLFRGGSFAEARGVAACSELIAKHITITER